MCGFMVKGIRTFLKIYRCRMYGTDDYMPVVEPRILPFPRPKKSIRYSKQSPKNDGNTLAAFENGALVYRTPLPHWAFHVSLPLDSTDSRLPNTSQTPISSERRTTVP